MIDKSIYERLKEERKKLKLTQATAAALAGIKRETWSRYESGLMSPGMDVLAALATAGANVQYILTGVTSGVTLSRDEMELLQHYRQAPVQAKASLLLALTMGSSRERAEQVIQGDVLGNVIKGDVTIGVGGIMNKNTKRK
ncbi:helix-turn-helix domain-containing protein [Serratia marcescens]|uniref:helix-turn-helix domain-containing protein n=1 Tax=Serratia marcescens TaxID=615 RepID=UPI001F4D67AA|nr:helix-turn-helix domain-containing protein [Serratia marcescens]